MNSRVSACSISSIFSHPSFLAEIYARERIHTPDMAPTASQAQERRPVSVDDDSDVDDLDGAEIHRMQY